MQRFPVLYWALFFLIGCGFAFHMHWAYIIPTTCLFYITKRKQEAILFLVMGMIYAFLRYPAVSETKQLEGRGIFQVERIQPVISAFQKSFALKGKFRCFQTEDKTYFDIPCMSLVKKIPKKGDRFLLEANIKDGRFKLKKGSFWQPIKSRASLVRWRFENKEKIRKFFRKKISDPQVSHFFSSLTTGDVDDHLLAMQFRKFGLGHLLAISGFHFALIAGALRTFFRLVASENLSYLLLLPFLGFYYFFLGFSPSVLRAFMMITLYVIGKLKNRHIEMCNLLGAALLLELIIDPHTATHLGFQLSFLATFGILVYYKPTLYFIEKILPRRNYIIARRMNLVDQHGYILSSMIRKGAALDVAVHLCTFPVILAIFHNFPLLSLIYNLLYPPLLGISMLLMPIGLLIPFLGELNVTFTGWILRMIGSGPNLLHIQIFISHIPFSLLLTILSAVGVFGLTKREQNG